MKILTILGARPQFIKAGTVSREIVKHSDIDEIIVHTGQHYDTNMSDIFFEEMQIPKPNYFLGIGGKTHGAMTGQMMEKIEEVALREKPDWVLVYGDTNSTLAGALVASKLHIKLAHIEAGLRSFNMKMPEEINRILTDRVSNILFCPTKTAVDNLKNEGFDRFYCKVVHSGDVMYDGALFYKKMAKKPPYKIEEVALREKPDWVLVYGDTNSTLAGALVATKLHIKLAHIEAGLRSFNMKMPEEINRILTDRVSKWLFCPTDTAVKNLKNEGFDMFDCKIIKSGDVMQDAALFYKQFAKKPQNLEIKDNFILSTIHRAENTDNKERLQNIFKALEQIAKEKQIILPLHPRTKKIIQNLNINLQNITIIEPVGYLEMVWLLEHSTLVITDSGGLQKEAFFFKKPCITSRDETEWIELIENGFNVLAGADKEKILDMYKSFKFNNNFDIDLYGNGKASEKIIRELLNG